MKWGRWRVIALTIGIFARNPAMILKAQPSSASLLIVKVTDRCGPRIPGATVIVTNQQTKTEQTAITRSDGSARLAVLPGRYEVLVHDDDHGTGREQIESPKTTIVGMMLSSAGPDPITLCATPSEAWYLDPQIPIVGATLPGSSEVNRPIETDEIVPVPIDIRIGDGQGAPLQNAKIQTSVPETAWTDSTGHTTLRLLPGTYDLAASAPGFSPEVKRVVVVLAAPSQATFELNIGPYHTQPDLRVTLSGQSSHTLYENDLASLPHKTVTYHNAHTKADETYSGVPLTTLLAKYGVATGDKLHGKPLSDYIVATGSDGYKAVIALAETDPSFHPGDVLVADAMNGKPIDPKDGPFRLIVTEDKRPARCVHNLVSIEVRSAD